jgi:outer membrane protein assembly factor BamA
MEYRAKIWSFIELAAFIDAGNVWTVFDYKAQPFGVFRWDEFYKQIALAYGVGLRMDFTFFIFRVDLGVKLYDPCRLYDGSNTQWRTVPNGLRWKDDMTLHFAIGYPF